MWKKFMSSIGFGNVTVDTKLEKKQYRQGEEITGIVEVRGGEVEQDIEGIVLTLIVKYEQDKEDSDFSYHEREIQEIILNKVQHIDSREISSQTFTMQLTKDHPVTTEKMETILRTKLIVPQAVDPEEEDQVVIISHDQETAL